MTLPHTYKDSDGHEIHVCEGMITILPVESMPSASVDWPTGSDAVALAKAVLEAAGDTGHRVVSEEHIKDLEAAAAYVAARSMREQAARLLDFRASKIRALPLLTDA
jgi:hypothetical protein